MKNYKKGFTFSIIIAIIAVLVISGGVVSAYKNKKAVLPVMVQKTVTTTLDWKTYTNSNLGISFKYPKEWGEVKPNLLSTEMEVSFNNSEVGLAERVYYNQTLGRNMTLGEIKNSFSDIFPAAAYLISQKNIVIDKKEGVEFFSAGSNSSGNTDIHIFVPVDQNNTMLMISFVYKPSDNTINNFNTFLSTFKFTTPIDQTVGWKTYTNTQYGFSFQYPESFGNLYDYTATTGQIAIGKIATDRVNSVDTVVGLSVPKIITNSTTGQPITFSAFISRYDSKGNTKTNVVVGGIQSVAVSSSQTGDTIFVPLSNNQIFEVRGNLKDSLFILMLSTFKFTTPATQPTDWTKYTHDQLMGMVDSDWKNKPMYFKGLEGNFLIIDQGTSPGPRGIIIYDLNAKKQVLSDSYSQPLDITSTAVGYWNPTAQKVTVQNCPDSVKWTQEGWF